MIIEEIRTLFPLVGKQDAVIHVAIDLLSPEIDRLANDVEYQGIKTRDTLPAPAYEENKT